MTNPQYKFTHKTNLDLICGDSHLWIEDDSLCFPLPFWFHVMPHIICNVTGVALFKPIGTLRPPPPRLPPSRFQQSRATLLTPCVSEQPKWATKKAGQGNISGTWTGRTHKNIKRVIYDPCPLPVPGKQLCVSKCPSGISICCAGTMGDRRRL